MTRLAHDDGTDRLFFANIESRDRPPLTEFIEAFAPAVVGLQQANRYKNPPRGYRLVGFRFDFEARGIKALVRDGVKIVKRKAIRMRLRWVGPKAGKWHGPRSYLALLLEYPNGYRQWVVVVHLETHNNPKAQAASLRRLARWLKRHGRYHVALIGDWNMTESELIPWANSVGAAVETVGKVDHAVIRGTKVRRIDRRLAPRGYHGWGVIKFETR